MIIGNLLQTFYILLTVLTDMIHGKWPTWRTILFYVFISIFYMFRATSCSSSGESTVSIQIGKFVSDLHTKTSPTQSDIYQMLYWYNRFFWWWARDCSKPVKNWNKYIEKNCASIWPFTKNHMFCVLSTVKPCHSSTLTHSWKSVNRYSLY